MNTSNNCNITNRAEKIYKHKNNGLALLLKELLSNSFHSLYIKSKQESDFNNPAISININTHVNTLTVSDNGHGIDEKSKTALSSFDEPNPLKKSFNLPSKGEGRLALIYYGANTVVTSIYKNKDSELVTERFDYPNMTKSNFELPFMSDNTHMNESGTRIYINLLRKDLAKNFIIQKNDSEKIREWILTEFFYFFITLDNLTIDFEHVGHNNSKLPDFSAKINFAKTQENYKTKTYSITLNNNKYDITLHAVKTDDNSNNITFNTIAHHVLIEHKNHLFENKKAPTFLTQWHKCYLVSSLFDDCIVDSGYALNMDHIEKNELRSELDKIIRDFYEKDLSNQKDKNIKKYKEVKKELKYFSTFLPAENTIEDFKDISNKDLKNTAFTTYSEVVTDFMHNKKSDPRIIQSALHLYVHHRSHVIDALNTLLKRVNEKDDPNNTLEADFHNLIFEQGSYYSSTNDANNSVLTKNKKSKNYFEHNLWLIDDKLAYFTDGSSTQRGERKSDIYLYNDRPKCETDTEKIQEIVVIELKRLTKPVGNTDAHNPTTMVDQLIKYITDLICSGIDPRTKEDVADYSQIKFYGYILASKRDIETQMKLLGIDVNDAKIPFLNSSYSFIKSIYPYDELDKPFRIQLELISSNDLYKIAKSRNKAFKEILNKYSDDDD